jgi:hypothetical protein
MTMVESFETCKSSFRELIEAQGVIMMASQCSMNAPILVRCAIAGPDAAKAASLFSGHPAMTTPGLVPPSMRSR